eukprot:357854-Chlamydomonas_euryale.AAC.4
MFYRRQSHIKCVEQCSAGRGPTSASATFSGQQDLACMSSMCMPADVDHGALTHEQQLHGCPHRDAAVLPRVSSAGRARRARASSVHAPDGPDWKLRHTRCCCLNRPSCAARRAAVYAVYLHAISTGQLHNLGWRIRVQADCGPHQHSSRSLSQLLVERLAAAPPS